MSNILIVAPHPDDETLGLGGTIAKLVAKGHSVYWLIITGMTESGGFSKEQIERRNQEIANVANYYNLEKVFRLDYPATQLNYSILGELISKVGKIVNNIEADEVYLPCPFDVHSDHYFTFEAMKAITKWFRYASIRRILCYETLSETNFNLPDIGKGNFVPNVYEDITPFINNKIEAMNIFASELGDHPFPRSQKAIESLAILRGSECGCKYAEAFMLLKEIRHE